MPNYTSHSSLSYEHIKYLEKELILEISVTFVSWSKALMSASHSMAQFNAGDEFSPAQLISIADKMMYKEKELKHLQ